MTEVVVHFGTQKTGSTTLQNYLQVNEDNFEEQGLKYGLAFRDRDNAKHTRLLNIKKNPSPSQEELFNWSQMVSRDLDSKPETLVYSEENLWSVFGFRDRTLSGLRSIFDNQKQITKITALVYVRRQDEFIASLFQENIKCGHFGQTLEDFSASKAADKKSDYWKNLRHMSKSFPDIIVKSLEGVVKDGGLLENFCASYGVNSSEMVEPSSTNEGLEAHATEALRRIVEKYYIQGDDRESARICRDKLVKYRSGPKLSMSLKSKEAIMERYAIGNKKLVKRCMPNSYNAFEDAPIVKGLTKEELSEERILELIGEAEDYLHSKKSDSSKSEIANLVKKFVK